MLYLPRFAARWMLLLWTVCSLPGCTTDEAQIAELISTMTRDDALSSDAKDKDKKKATCFVDADGDGHGITTTLQSEDKDCKDAGESELDDDCNDADAGVHPKATDIPNNGIDENCSGADETTTCVKTALFLTKGGSKRDAANDAITARLQQLGYRVNVVTNGSDNNSDPTGFALVLIAAHGSSGERAARFVNTAVPVMTWAPNAFATLGMAPEGSALAGVSNGSILRPTHPLAAGLTSTVALFTAPSTAHIAMPASTAAVVVTKPGDPSAAFVWGYEAGAVMSNGAAAPARRTGFFLNDDNADELSAQGWALFDAAVNWSVGGAGCGGRACYADVDRDGIGSSVGLTSSDGDCSDPGESEASNDCNDNLASAYPGAPEVAANGVDEDCNGVDAVLCYTDADQDGFGKAPQAIALDGDCTDAQESAEAGDCNDAVASIRPGATEVPGNGVDEDCNGSDARLCQADADGDGVGGTATVTSADNDCTDAGEAGTNTDCDEANKLRFPGATDVAGNGVDEDCSGSDARLCFVDQDGDGFGSATTRISVDSDCDDAGESALANDCNDAAFAVRPGGNDVPANGVDEDCNGVDAVPCQLDADGDGFGAKTVIVATDGDCTDAGESTVATDCDDGNANVRPNAVEVPGNGIDENCNGSDERLCQADADGDGFGTSTTVASADDDCTDPGESSSASDCNDSSATTFPGATETAGDGVDQDCNGLDARVCYQDSDRDGFGSSETAVALDGDCLDAGESSVATDCNDRDASIYPGATEVADNATDEDCNGTDARQCFVDADGDRFGSSATLIAADGDCADTGESQNSGDCDDANAAIYPGATDTAGDGVDQDCSGFDSAACYVDADADGYGSAVVLAPDGDCTDAGEAARGGDCDDTRASVHVGAAEIAGDGIDQDCSGSDARSCFVDADGDRAGSSLALLSADADCTDAGEAESSNDCDDTRASIFPEAAEIAGDGIDQNCDGVDAPLCFVDADRDGFGGRTALAPADGDCVDAGESTNDNDCDDSNAAVRPSATEIAGNGVDDNCDGVEGRLCQRDGDGDGYGAAATITSADADCSDAGEATTSGDCDDSHANINPNAVDVANNGADEDCNGVDATLCFVDADRDSYGSLVSVTAADGDCTDAGESALANDCDDTRASIRPGATDTAEDGIDQDCDGVDARRCFVDNDRDGFGSTATTVSSNGSCARPGMSTSSSDCNDARADVFPANSEIPGDGVDQDCSGSDAATCFVDSDGDGFGRSATLISVDADCNDAGESSSSRDCDDTLATVSPNAAEIPGNGRDDNCDGTDAVTCFVDADGDGLGGSSTLLALDGDCIDAGESSVSTDCNDTQASVKPGAAETADNGVDEDCNGVDARRCQVDGDRDGFGGSATLVAIDGECTDPGESVTSSDCNDTNAGINPGATDTPGNGTDEDCNGFDARLCRVDNDRDGFGTTATVVALDGDCTDPGESTIDSDCNDNNAAVSPAGVDIAGNGVDEDCNGVDARQCQSDADRDGFGGISTVVSLDADCTDAGESATANDCDDAKAAIFPSATEIAGNGIDEDCNGVDARTCFVDSDGDGFGSTQTRLALDGDCTDPQESVNSQDCNDSSAAIKPGGAEVADNGLDEDCNGVDAKRCFRDSDRDGFGGAIAMVALDGDCTDAAESAVNTDCNDTNASVNPSATDIAADGIDQDCSGADTAICFVDNDRDGFGSAVTRTAADGDCTDAGESSFGTDCNDSARDVYPGAPDALGDGRDSDCDNTDG